MWGDVREWDRISKTGLIASAAYVGMSEKERAFEPNNIIFAIHKVCVLFKQLEYIKVN